ncbi:hypothetical protein GCM10027059_02000 [Myceligenerans halotolerans]
MTVTLPTRAPLPEWMRHGSCTSGPERLLPWIAEPGDASAAEVAAMARVCASCPVRLACAVDARRESAGFWAGRERGHLDPVVLAGPLGEPVQDTLPLDELLVDVTLDTSDAVAGVAA